MVFENGLRGKKVNLSRVGNEAPRYEVRNALITPINYCGERIKFIN